MANGEKWGLYCGEALVALGELRLKRNLDPEGAVQWFKKAEAWLAGVEGSGADWSKFKSPEKSAEVTVSPQEALGFDNWGNVHEPRPKSGALVNHLTAPWYLDRLRLRNSSNLLFVYFVQGREQEAKPLLERIRRLDRVGQESDKIWAASFARRMEWNLLYNKGCLRATPAEAAAFVDPKRRLLMFLADYAYEREDREEAERLYNRLMQGEWGKLTQAEEAYIYTSLAFCMGWKRKEKYAAADLLKVFEKKWQDTPSAPIALLGCANLLTRDSSDRQRRESGIRYYDLVEQRYPHTEEAADALFLSGWTSYLLGDRKEAAARFTRYAARYPKGAYIESASLEYFDKHEARAQEIIKATSQPGLQVEK